MLTLFREALQPGFWPPLFEHFSFSSTARCSDSYTALALESAISLSSSGSSLWRMGFRSKYLDIGVLIVLGRHHMYKNWIYNLRNAAAVCLSHSMKPQGLDLRHVQCLGLCTELLFRLPISYPASSPVAHLVMSYILLMLVMRLKKTEISNVGIKGSKREL